MPKTRIYVISFEVHHFIQLSNMSIFQFGMRTGHFLSDLILRSKAMRSVKRYACYAKTAEFLVIPTLVITVINVRIPLR